MKGARGPYKVVNYIVNYCCKRKMLKEDKLKKKTFLSHFYHWWHFDWGALDPPPPRCYAYDFSYDCSNLKEFYYKVVRRIGGGSYRKHSTPYYSNLKIIKLSDLLKLEIAKLVFRHLQQRWKPVGLPVGSRFFDRPVKPVEKPGQILLSGN